MDPRLLIEQKTQEIVKNLGNFELSESSVEYNNNFDFGDLSTNFALLNYAKLKDKFESPKQLAIHIVDKLEADHDIKNLFEKITVDGPGFINFWFSTAYLQKQLGEIISKGEDYGSLEFGRGKKVLVEFVSANPTGPLHMGNVRGGPIGDVLANVLKKAGFQVSKEYYVNDVGGQIQRFGLSLYNVAKGEALENQEYKGEYIKELASKTKSELGLKVFEDIPAEELIKKFAEFGVKHMIQNILDVLEEIGIKYDDCFYESSFADKSKDIPSQTETVIHELGSSVKQKDNAQWFAPNDEFLKDRESVLVKSDGSYTYFANDIAYHENKYERGFDILIDVWGANHHGHVPRMKAAIAALGHDPDSLKIILYQWVSLIKDGKLVSMSKRKGEFITVREVLDEIKSRDAMRFLLLTSASSSHINLDLDLAKKQASDNPVFYVQYAYARISSIFKKAPGVLSFENSDFSLLKNPDEISLIRHLMRLPVLVGEISKDFGVNRLTTYSITLADLFHKFYESCRVLTDNKAETQARLALVKSTQIVLKNTLDLLGVSAPERM